MVLERLHIETLKRVIMIQTHGVSELLFLDAWSVLERQPGMLSESSAMYEDVPLSLLVAAQLQLVPLSLCVSI